ncbi:MAG: bifunctional proline dehydrogenase/L-glutamate gamma-semialdehyde dehydrogenase PutA [Kangiellaceae bacterium]|jgi:RHH-type proline utilization regulon transcriptional repressor/proline dehydrogenase/delta 1-pyrroline-5-carboxylate dehydrogenase|nr:bifunctional proline dehydrogenase/L-glutamate gamma-semialdehyde dehydrogenase PutA [Kangiellaceae bacterium]
MFKASEVLNQKNQKMPELWQAITDNYIVDETAYLEELLTLAEPSAEDIKKITKLANDLVVNVRKNHNSSDGIEAFLQQYSLSTKEGVILMCLAEALLRIPDAEVANNLIKDKIEAAEWKEHLGQSDSWLVNSATWGLMLTGGIVSFKKDKLNEEKPTNYLKQLINKCGEPVIRQSMNQAMKLMGKQFVLGRSIDEALKRGAKSVELGYTHSFDMLGEAAYTMDDAKRYFNAYKSAIEAIGKAPKNDKVQAPSISIKLSALHPRYEHGQHDRVMSEMYDSVVALAETAKELDVAITIDAEEMDRLELSLELFGKIFRSDVCQNWEGFGLVVQAYSKRALPVLCWLNALSQDVGRIIPLRLVKGAYWDSEIKWSQQAGIDAYPVYTRKAATDVSYLACARYILSTEGSFYAQFATHNAQTAMNILHWAGDRRDFEFQRLHGMGEELYNLVLEQYAGINVRIYAPVGEHKDLLPYLVRRLLENGANTSFVHRLVDEQTPVSELVGHPCSILRQYETLANNKIPLPPAMYGSGRTNSSGTNLHIDSHIKPFMAGVESHLGKTWHSAPIIDGKTINGDRADVTCPYDVAQTVGTTINASKEDAERAIQIAQQAQPKWNRKGAEHRAALLDKTADLMEAGKHELIALCSREAGKTMQDGIDEVREAVDFCRYYAMKAREDFAEPMVLPGPTGESNEIYLQGRGVFACISPWNFPLAIFIGQVAAALAAGNSVICKPAGQTTLIAHRAVQMMHEAGIPGDVLHYVPGKGSVIGQLLATDPRIAGVAFTGSTDTAVGINQSLASRVNSPISPLIAETGGQNAMIVDSSALPEQIVDDVIHSAFTSAGQRCSALRVLYLQEEIAPRVIEILKGAMNELVLGNPTSLKTDIGPVIDDYAKTELEGHIQALKEAGALLAEGNLPELVDGKPANGHFVAPVAFKIDSINDLEQEWFGPVLHIITYKAKELDAVIDSINNYGYGLTLGIHSRNESTAKYIDQRVKVGNVYINRNMIGAVVGVQPFGGQGLSGTGPKAGGPRYLHRFATERTRTNNTAAIGGNATLLSLGD